MLTIIHGDDLVESLKKLDSYTKSSDWIIRFNGKKDKVIDVLNGIAARELFTDKKTLVIENFSSLSLKDSKAVLSQILKAQESMVLDVIVLEEKTLNKKLLASFPSNKIFEYKLPRFFYLFLDNLMPGNGKELHEFLLKLEANLSPEQIFYGLIKRIRHLLQTKTGNPRELDDIKLLADWQLRKISKQADYWTIEKLLNFYKKVFDLEFSLKTSQLPLPLGKHLEILLLTELN